MDSLTDFLAKEPEYFARFAVPFLEMLKKEPGTVTVLSRCKAQAKPRKA